MNYSKQNRIKWNLKYYIPVYKKLNCLKLKDISKDTHYNKQDTGMERTIIMANRLRANGPRQTLDRANKPNTLHIDFSVTIELTNWC